MNRKDDEGRNLFQGGFLGLDNISVIDRSMALRPGSRLEQADGTAWMATYCLNMAWAALELSPGDPVYEDLAIKFFEHFLSIGGAMNGSQPTRGPVCGTRRTGSTTTTSAAPTASGCR